VNANAIAVGDLFVGRDGLEVRVVGVTDTGRWERVYNFRVADWHKYYVGDSSWGFDIWAHNTTCSPHASILRANMIQAGQKALTCAAHLFPTGAWSHRSLPIQQAIANVQHIVNQAGIGFNHTSNGFFTGSTRHLGTHTNRFFIYLNQQLPPLAENRAAILAKLNNIQQQLLSGGIKF
jgi:hypothetical protein